MPKFARGPLAAIVPSTGVEVIVEGLMAELPKSSGRFSPNLSLSLNAETLAAEAARLSAQAATQLASQTDLPPDVSLNGHKTKPARTKSSKPTSPKQHSSSLSLSQAKLAQRLGLTSRNLSRERSKPEFSEWSSGLDPEGLAWSYDANAKLFKSLAKPLLESIDLDLRLPPPPQKTSKRAAVKRQKPAAVVQSK